MPKKAQMNANYRKNERLLEDGAIDVPTESGRDSYTAGSGISISEENVISNTAPNVPQEQADWNEADSTKVDYIKNKPTIPAEQVNSDWEASSGKAEILNKPTLSTVATSGSYNDLSDKPTIPDAQVQANWNESDTSSKAFIQNKPTIPTGVPSSTSADEGKVLTVDSNGDAGWQTASSGGSGITAHHYNTFGELANDIVAHVDSFILRYTPTFNWSQTSMKSVIFQFVYLDDTYGLPIFKYRLESTSSNYNKSGGVSFSTDANNYGSVPYDATSDTFGSSALEYKISDFTLFY